MQIESNNLQFYLSYQTHHIHKTSHRIFYCEFSSFPFTTSQVSLLLAIINMTRVIHSTIFSLEFSQVIVFRFPHIQITFSPNTCPRYSLHITTLNYLSYNRRIHTHICNPTFRLCQDNISPIFTRNSLVLFLVHFLYTFATRPIRRQEGFFYFQTFCQIFFHFFENIFLR